MQSIKRLKTYKYLLFFLAIIVSQNAFSQGSWNSKFYFNIKNSKGQKLNKNNINENDIHFYSSKAYKNSKIGYDEKLKAFFYSSNSISESRSFLISMSGKTYFIEFLGIVGKSIFVKDSFNFEINNNAKFSLYKSCENKFIANNKSAIVSSSLEQIFYFDIPIAEEFAIPDEKNIEEIFIY